MIAYYLNTADEAAMRSALLESGAVTEQDGDLVPIEGITLDVIGPWFSDTGQTTTDAAGNAVPVMAQVPGWFFNVYAQAEIAWPASVTIAQPVTPWRVIGRRNR